MPLHNNKEFRLCLQMLAAELKESRANFLLRPPLETLTEEAYSRGLLQGKEEFASKLVELAHEDLLNRKEEENGTDRSGSERHVGITGQY